jgi:hypothetical protein
VAIWGSAEGDGKRTHRTTNLQLVILPEKKAKLAPERTHD